MGLILFIVLGGLAGWIAGIIMRTDALQGVGTDIVIGCAGAVIGGSAFNALGSVGITGFNLWSLLVAVVGSVVLLTIARALRRV